MRRPSSNPFSTRFTTPGRIESLDVGGNPVDVGLLLDRLERLGGSAAIVGPHGSGKSTLLTHVADEIDRRGGRVSRLRLRSWHDAAPVWRAIRRMGGGGTLCIDSWECLGLVVRVLFRLAAGVSGCRLLVTSHRGDDLPVLTHCVTSARLLHAIVRSLPEQGLWRGVLITPRDVEEAFAGHRGNLRESLWELYDRFEYRVRRPAAGGGDDGRAGGAGRAAAGGEIHETVDGFSYAGAPERNLG